MITIIDHWTVGGVSIPGDVYPSSLQTTVASFIVQLLSHTGDHTPSLLHISTSWRLLLFTSLTTVTLPSMHEDILPAAEYNKTHCTVLYKTCSYTLTIATYDDICGRQ